ncbi:hypothetical protein IWQ61_005387 [Dispira simplex]|nr:hypothetical protein IWQ61_005387 [Dispira simplex]
MRQLIQTLNSQHIRVSLLKGLSFPTSNLWSEGLVHHQRVLYSTRRLPITLLNDQPGLGKAGEVVYVKPGYMRNVLYPKGVADYVLRYNGPRNRQAEAEAAAIRAREEAIKSGVLDPSVQPELYLLLKSQADKIQTITHVEFVRTTVKANDDTIFGSISPEDVLAVLRDQHQVELDKGSIEMPRIKTLGEHKYMRAAEFPAVQEVLKRVNSPQEANFGSLSVKQLQYHMTLLKWFSTLTYSDPFTNAKFLLLAEERYVRWLTLLKHRTWEANTIPVPPIDVTLMWHAHLLSPFAYYEDMSMLEHNGLMLQYEFPLEKLHEIYLNGCQVPDDSVRAWQEFADMSYQLQLDDFPRYKTHCPWCKTDLDLSWEEAVDFRTRKHPQAHIKCSACKAPYNRDVLSGRQFWEHVHRHLTVAHTYLRGTVIDVKRGEQLEDRTETDHTILFDGLSAQAAVDRRDNWHACRWKNILSELNEVKTRARRRRFYGNIRPYTIARIVSRYREQISPFSLDLCRAVLRQQEFTAKMVQGTWQCPATLGIAIIRYVMFLSLMKNVPNQVLIPTLDIDLAWHTHQLTPKCYQQDTVRVTNRIINHDDTYPTRMLQRHLRLTASYWYANYKEPYTIEDLYTEYVKYIPRLVFAVLMPVYGVYVFFHARHIKKIQKRPPLAEKGLAAKEGRKNEVSPNNSARNRRDRDQDGTHEAAVLPLFEADWYCTDHGYTHSTWGFVDGDSHAGWGTAVCGGSACGGGGSGCGGGGGGCGGGC